MLGQKFSNVGKISDQLSFNISQYWKIVIVVGLSF